MTLHPADFSFLFLSLESADVTSILTSSFHSFGTPSMGDPVSEQEEEKTRSGSHITCNRRNKEEEWPGHGFSFKDARAYKPLPISLGLDVENVDDER